MRLLVASVLALLMCLAVNTREPDLNQLVLAAAADLQVDMEVPQLAAVGAEAQAEADRPPVIAAVAHPVETRRSLVPTLADLRELLGLVLGDREIGTFLGGFAGAALVMLLAWWRIASAVGSENRVEVEEWERF